MTDSGSWLGSAHREMRQGGLKMRADVELQGRWAVALCTALFLIGLINASTAFAASPYEFDPNLSLTGGCGVSKADEVPDPGCPEKKPPKTFTSPRGIAIDSFGNEYVASLGAEEGKQGRIDVFSPKGVFITEIPDPHGPRTVAVDSKGNLYVWEAVSGEPIQAVHYTPTVYKPAEEKIEYGLSRTPIASGGDTVGDFAIDASNDHVFVSFGNAIREYSSAAEGNKLEETITNESLESNSFLAMDSSRRRLYASSCRNAIFECFVLVLNADKPHEVLEAIEGPEGHTSKEGFFSTKGWISTAVDEETGDFFVGDLELTNKVYQFDAAYNPISTLNLSIAAPGAFEGGEAMQIAVSNAPKGTKNRHYLFVPSLKGRALAFSPPKCEAPVVEEGGAAGIAENEAELQALVKPQGCSTTYRFEYLSQQEYEEAGNSFSGAILAGEGTIVPTEQEAQVKAAVDGLEQGTEYRFRIVATNEIENEGKLEGGEDEEEASFTTYSEASITSECPEAIRNTYSTLLPDCRAYELVTPADTNGRSPRGVGFTGDQFLTVEASPGGEAVSFLTEGGTIPGLGGSGAFNGSPYRSSRTSSGWTTVNAGPSGVESSLPSAGSTSPDQGYLFWKAIGGGSAVIEGKDAHYVRYPDGHSALVGRGTDPETVDPEAIGKRITENGTHIVFQTQEGIAIPLQPDAPPLGTGAVYDRTPDEVTHVVSLLPGDKTPAEGEDAEYINSSDDGEGIVFRVGATLYLRVADTTTYEIGEGVFAGVSEGGRRAFYLEGGDLFAFDTGSEEAIRFTEVGNAIPVSVAADGARAYFVSTTAIPGPEERKPQWRRAHSRAAEPLPLRRRGG